MNKRLMWSIYRYVLSLFLVLVLLIGIFVYWAVGGSLPKKSDLPLEPAEKHATQAPEHLVVATYNIGHGQGIKEQAWDYRDKATTEKQLSAVALAIVNLNADIVLLQEVDINSDRTFHINQIEFVKARTQHPFHACAIVWEKNYLPFPYWPPTHHLGYIRAANCILSRFPMSHHQRLIFAKPESNPFWYNWGYIDRGIERVNVAVGDHNIAVLNIHLEAWETAAREQQIKDTLAYVKEIDLPIILGGDFNTVLPDAPKKSGFADDPFVNYAGEQTLQWFYEHAPNLTIPHLTATSTSPFDHYTFPSNLPDRRLDHIFLLGKSLSFVNYRVGHEAGTASDHLPVVATIRYR